MATTQRFLCVIGNKNDPNYSCVCCLGRWQKRVDLMNSTSEEKAFYCCFTLDVETLGTRRQWGSAINRALTLANIIPEHDYVYMVPPSALYDVIHDFADANGVLEYLSPFNHPQPYTPKKIYQKSHAPFKNPREIIEEDNISATETHTMELHLMPKEIRPDPQFRIDKEYAQILVEYCGLLFGYKVLNKDNLYYATKFRHDNYYILSPKINSFSNDCSIILNDSINKIFFLFNIPKHSLNQKLLAVQHRGTPQEAYYMHVAYLDASFSDLVSTNQSIKLRPYLAEILQYGTEGNFTQTNNNEFWKSDGLPYSNYSLATSLNTTIYMPTSVCYRGEIRRVNSYVEFAGTVLNLLVKYNYSTWLERVAENTSQDKFVSCLALDESLLKCPIHVSGTPLYYEGAMDDKTAYEFAQRLAKGIDVDLKSITYRIRRRT